MDDTYIPQINQEPTASAYALAALVVGGFTGLLAIAIAGISLILWPALRPHWPLILVLLPLIISAAVAGIRGISWVSESATRAWRINDYALLQDQSPIITETSSDNTRIILSAGQTIMIQHYIHGTQATRPELENLGIQQAHWNSANTILQALGIKRSRTWNDQIDAETAFQLWAGVQPMTDNSVMIQIPGTSDYQRLDL